MSKVNGQQVPVASSNYQPQQPSAVPDGSTLVVWLTVAFGLTMVVSVIAAFSNFAQITLIGRMLSGDFTFAEVDANDTRQLVIAWIQLALYALTAMLFLLWVYRAHRNLPRMGANDPTYSPGWAVGWWFVPIANYWMPLLVMSEIWRGSDPAYTDSSRSWRSAPVAPQLGIWWALWALGGMFGGILLFVSLRGVNTLENLRLLTVGVLVSDLLTLGAAVLAIWIVRAIDARQSQKLASLGLGLATGRLPVASIAANGLAKPSTCANPACGRTIKPDWDSCPYCLAKRVNRDANGQVSEPVLVGASDARCANPQCARVLKREWNHCPYCESTRPRSERRG